METRKTEFTQEEVDQLMDMENRINYLGQPPNGITMYTLLKIPEEVRDWAIENVVWFCPHDCNACAVTTAVLTEGKPLCAIRVIYIAPHVFEQPEEEQERVIAHEVAHFWLKHDQPAMGKEEADKRERAVEKLILDWGFKTEIPARSNGSGEKGGVKGPPRDESK